MPLNNFNLKGLSKNQVDEARLKYGTNSVFYKKENGFADAVKKLAKEPMVILLLVTSGIYFISKKNGDGFFLASAVVLVSCISLFQDSRSRNALEKLKDFSQPKSRVIRDGVLTELKSEDLVVGDSLIVEEGASITADGVIIHSNDFSVNESILTGESMPVNKDQSAIDNMIFQGTTVASGLAVARIIAIGNQTRLGKIGKSLEAIEEEKTPLEMQINNFVKKMVVAGVLVFGIVWALNYIHSYNFSDSLIKALTLAMSILPEEIPVAFTTFMALGAWRLMKMGIIVKQMKTVETLGSASVICTDKTGTITENKMSLAKVFAYKSGQISDAQRTLDQPEQELITIAMWASEPVPFDPMEVALHEAYLKMAVVDERPHYKMIHEYPLSGKPPMMTHLFENEKNERIIAAKGAPEALMKISHIGSVEKQRIEGVIKSLAAEGHRILAVGLASFPENDFPATQQEFKFEFKGLIAFYDPPKKDIDLVLETFYKAGIAVKIVTGDNTATTQAVARQINFKGADQYITGEELMDMNEKQLEQKVETLSIFSRMYPDAKLKIIKALKSRQETVAMIGDGVNDGPALKAAHIGIAMGKKGTEIAKQAASLILLEDDLSKMADAVAMGRRIYTNLKKAIQYIISIHIPIILTVFLPLALGWIYPNIFSPVHIIFLELIMGPTCSIIYENEPMEKDTMLHKPRPFSTTFFSWKELATSILQGLAITTGSLLTYQWMVRGGADESLTRTMVFTFLIAANIVLTLVNRSFYFSLFTTIKYKNNLVFLIIAITTVISGVLLYVKTVSTFFGFKPLNSFQLAMSVFSGFLSVIWYEVVKWRKRVTESVIRANNL